MEQYLRNLVAWLSETWKVWVVFSIVVSVAYCLWWYLFQQRTYRAINGQAQVKHGHLGHWQNLDDHLKKHDIDINQLGR